MPRTVKSSPNPRMGSNFEDFLREQGRLEIASSLAIKRVIAWEFGQAMQKANITQTEMAKRMGSRLQSPFKDRNVYVRAVTSRDRAEITIRDEGPGFDPSKIPDPTDPAFLDRPCGRGLWLIHAFIDEVRHNATGNEITMILRKQSETEGE